jgi:hypothetical protein
MNLHNRNGNHQSKVIRYIDLFCGIGGLREVGRINKLA